MSDESRAQLLFPPLLASRWVQSLHDDDIAALVAGYEQGRAELTARPQPSNRSSNAPADGAVSAPGEAAIADSMLRTLNVLHLLASVTFEHLCRVNVLLGPAVHEFAAWARSSDSEPPARVIEVTHTVAEVVPSIARNEHLIGEVREQRLRLKTVEHAAAFLTRAGGARGRHPAPARWRTFPTVSGHRLSGARARTLRHHLDELEGALTDTLGVGLGGFLATTTVWAERYAMIIDEINSCYVAVRAYRDADRDGGAPAGGLVSGLTAK